MVIFLTPLSWADKNNPPPEKLRATVKALKDWRRSKDFSPLCSSPSGRLGHPRGRFSLGRRRKGTGGSRQPGRAAGLAWAPGAAGLAAPIL